MNVIIKTEELGDLTLDEALYLFALHQNTPIDSKTQRNLCAKGYLFAHESSHIPRYSITREGVDIIEQVILNSEFKGNNAAYGRYENLAIKLRELFPEGKKAGTNYYWRDSVAIIAKRLKALVKKNGECFTDEQAITATKEYVSSFNGNYQYMQLLKYFISKQKVVDGTIEEDSQLLSYIENAGQEAKQRDDWMSTII